MRHTGIDVIGDIPWGTHFCQFYETSQDLIETLVPYFKEGLAANESCKWVTSEPLQVRQAKAALKAAVPDLDKYIRKGQIEIIDYSKWYTRSGKFSADEVLQGWVGKLAEALEKGYEGLRLTGNTFWLEKADWEDFRLYEEAINNVIGRYKMLAFCTYSLRKCGATEIIDVVANHEFALIKRQGRWETIESSGQKQAEQDLKRAHEMLEAVTRGSQVIMAAVDKDFRYTFYNKEYETEIKRLTGKDIHIGTSIVKLFSHMPEQQKVAVEEWSQVFRGETTVKTLEFGDPGIHRRVYNIHHTPLRDDLGNVVGAGEVAYDITEQARAQDMIKEAALKYSTMLQTAQSGFGLFDMEGKLLEVNDAYCRMSGYSRDELLNMHISDLEANETPEDILKYIKFVREHGHHQFESRHRRKDGSVFDVEIRASYLDIEGGRLVIFAWDISDRKKMERALRESEARFRVLAEAMPQIVWSADASGAVDYYNRRTYEFGGVQPGDIKGWNWSSVIHRDDLEPTVAAWRRAIETGEIYEIEHRLRRADGEYRWHLTRGVPFRDEQGHVVRWIGTATDIQDQKATEEALRKERDFSTAVLETAGALVVVLDQDGRITRFNRACETMTGYSESEVLGRVFWDFLVPQDELVGVHQAWKALQAGDFPNLHENHWLAKDGSRRLIAWSNSALVRPNGEIEYIIGTGIDITERRKAREELHRTREHLENLIDYANAPIIVWDPLFKITRFNHAFERLTGLKAADVIDKPLDILFPETSRAESLAHIQRTLTGERWEVVEIPILRTDGTIRTVLWNSANIYEKDGTTLTATIAQGQDITERKRMEEETLRLASFPLLNPQPIVEVDAAGHICFANPAAQTLFPDLQHLGPDHPWLADWDSLAQAFRRPKASLPAREALVGERWYHQTMYLVPETRLLRIYGTDISSRIRAEQELRRLNRTLTALSHSNQALIRAANEQEFLDEASQIIVKDCGHAMVWIGYAEDDEEKSVRPVAYAGFEKGYLETLKISWADTERGRGPTGTAIRTGKPCACTNMLTDPKFAPWREQAVARGYASSLVLPFLADGKAFGAISIYFRQSGAVSEDETRLLTELANDVAYGISSIRLRDAHARAEDALRESEYRYRSLFETMSEGFGLHEIVCDDSGTPCDYRFLEVNPAFERQSGLKAADIVGRSVREVLPEIETAWVERYGRVALTGEPAHFEQWSGPLERCYEVSAFQTDLGRFAATFLDITDRKRAEDALRQRTEELQLLTGTLEQRVRERTAELAEANELLQAEVTHSHFIEKDLRQQKEALQTVIDNIPVMLCFYDSSGKAKMTNREFDRLLGWSRGEAERLGIVMAEAGEAALRPEPQSSAAEGIPGWREHKLKTRGGDDLESSWATVRLSDGGQIGIGIDMRERREAEQERLRLAAAVEQADRGMAITDAEGLIIYVNRAFERTSGSVRSDLLGRRYYDWLTGEGAGESLGGDVEKTVRGGGAWSGHLIRKIKNEQSRELDITVSPIRDRSGNVINYLVLERDVTQEVRLQQHLRQVQKMEALGTLAGGIAHDFNNILNPIFINTELILMDAALDDETRRELEITLKAAERGRDLVKQIITFSRQKEKERKPAKVGPVIKEAVKFLRSSLAMTIEIHQNIEPETGFILADPTQIHQVVMNLCNNGADAMRERGGLLDVSLAEIEVDQDMALRHPDLKPGPYLRLMVADTGTGMTPEVMERAFDPFFTTKKPGEGSGMGLAVVHGIVRDYVGAITVYSEVGRGTTFNIFLPRVPAEEIQPEAAAESLAQGTERILLVDDEEVQVRSMRNMLKRLGYHVTAKTDSAEALKAFRKDPGHFDLVITDQTMPRLTGAHLAQEILSIRPDLPIILCTGFSEKVDADGAHAMGIREFLMKPFSIREMAGALKRALEKK